MKSSQTAVLLLTGAIVKAASPASPLRAEANSYFPKYKTVDDFATLDSSQKDTNGNLKQVFNQVSDGSGGASYDAGLYRCIRSNFYAFPTQTIFQADQATSSSKSAVVAPSTMTDAKNTRTWWQTNSSMLGSYANVLDATSQTTAQNTAAKSATWVCCGSITNLSDARKCNGGAGWNQAGSSSHVIPYRIVINASTNGNGVSYAGGQSSPFSWKSDFLLAALYHSSPLENQNQSLDGSMWCSAWSTKLTKDGLPFTIQAANGLNGKSKCSWMILTDSGLYGPAIMLKRADYANFLF